jgi:hypothetical protein
MKRNMKRNMKNSMNFKIRSILLALTIIMSPPLWAGCESSIIEGSHTALKKKDAKIGAWEDASDACYPGEATKINMQCKKVSADKGVQGKRAVKCVQEATCNICDANLTRKYEALN